MAQAQILIIEDDNAIRQGIRDAIEFEGYSALEASDGESGLARALRVDCDLVLLDLVLPKVEAQLKTGRRSLQRLATRLRARRIRVLAIEAAQLQNLNTPADLAAARKTVACVGVGV